MKKITYLLAGLLIIFGLAACNHQQDETTNQDSPTSQSQDGSTKQDQPTSPTSDEKVYQNKVFKDVIVTMSEDKIMVKGKAQVFEGVFQYVLYDGEKVLIQNHYQTDGAPAWGEFEITFEKRLVSSNDVKLELFVFSAKDGSKVNTLDIPIPKPY